MQFSGRTQGLLPPLPGLPAPTLSLKSHCVYVPIGSAPDFSLSLVFNIASMNISQVISGNAFPQHSVHFLLVLMGQ